MAIDLSVGYPYAVSVRDIKGNAVRGLVICHDINTALTEYSKRTRERYPEPVDVMLFKMGEKKAPDGVWDQYNEPLRKCRVTIQKKTREKVN